MGILVTFKKITLSLIALVNIIFVLALWVCAWAGHVSPERHAICEVISLGFPIPLAINVLFLIFWLLVSVKYALIPIIGMLVCFNSVRDYCPINFLGSKAEDDIMVMSFNINNFNGAKAPDSDFLRIANYIVDSGADIVCLQESQIPKKSMKEEVLSILEKTYPYHEDNKKPGSVTMSLFSKYPIKWTKDIPFENDSRITEGASKNVSMVGCIDLNGNSLLVFNCHLNSHGFNPEDKSGLQDFVERKTDHIDEQPYISKITQTARIRALQADFVARTLKKHHKESVVLCGDFNSSPTSYEHHAIGKYLTDCFRSAGNGVGYSFYHYRMYVRIDHIFCSDDWQPQRCKIDKNFTLSDHLPIVCWLKKRPNP